MASVDDVAAAILELTGPIDTFKLQKLLYYSQAWHLVWDAEEIFPDPIEAWAGGPVVRSIYENHRQRFTVREWPRGHSDRLTESERATVQVVVESYGRLTGRQLSTLTHKERPWRVARGDLGPGDRGHNEIDPNEMADYYGGLDQDELATAVAELPTDAAV